MSWARPAHCFCALAFVDKVLFFDLSNELLFKLIGKFLNCFLVGVVIKVHCFVVVVDGS